MKRWVTRKRVCLFLLLLAAGAIVNIAVAWSLSVLPRELRAPVGEHYTFQTSAGYSQSLFEVHGVGFHHVLIGYPFSGIYVASMGDKALPSWTGLHENIAAYDNDPDHDDLHEFRASGWPCLALLYRFRTSVVRYYGPAHATFVADAWRVGTNSEGRSRFFLPTMPIWPGFAINTLFYAGILWLLFAAPFALRRWRRIKRGLCPKCAYPIGTREVCTECGAAVPLSLGRRM